DRGVGSGVDHRVRGHLADHGSQALRVIQVRGDGAATIVQAPVARRGHDLAQCDQATAQLAPELAVAADEQDPGHGVYTGRRSSAISARNGALESLADSTGSAMGQSTPMSPSFQRTPASASFTYTSVHR